MFRSTAPKTVRLAVVRLFWAAGMLAGLSGCLMSWIYGDWPDTIGMAPGVHSLTGLNSPFDDFNASAVPPPLRMDALIAFASNAGTRGERFAIETGRLRIVQNPYSRRKDKRPPPPEILAERTGPFPRIPASEHNHLGPSPLVASAVPERLYEAPFRHYMTLGLDLNRESMPWEKAGELAEGGVWLFDSDREGRRNLYFVDEAGRARPFFGNDLRADDAYATYDFERHELYFSSNRSGRFRIYRHRNRSGDIRFSRWLDDPDRAGEIEPVPEFESPGNSLAPFVDEDLLVFASDRPGGSGGYDLYLSRRGDEGWESPRNLREWMPEGVALNTPANEFRPSILRLGFRNFPGLRVLIFSSDRPGGQGGYDLYLTALPEMDRPQPRQRPGLP